MKIRLRRGNGQKTKREQKRIDVHKQLRLQADCQTARYRKEKEIARDREETKDVINTPNEKYSIWDRDICQPMVLKEATQ